MTKNNKLDKQPITVRELLTIIQDATTKHPELLDMPVTTWALAPEMCRAWMDDSDQQGITGDAAELIDVNAAVEVWNERDEPLEPFFELILRKYEAE